MTDFDASLWETPAPADVSPSGVTPAGDEPILQGWTSARNPAGVRSIRPTARVGTVNKPLPEECRYGHKLNSKNVGIHTSKCRNETFYVCKMCSSIGLRLYRESRKLRMKPTECLRCKTPLDGKQVSYCSTECMTQGYKPPPSKFCEQCTAPLKRGQTRYCRMACYREANKPKARECPACRKEILRSDRTYCSRECIHVAHKAGSGSRPYFTVEQIAIMRERYPTKEPLDKILAAVVACEGGYQCNERSIREFARRQNIKRGRGVKDRTPSARVHPLFSPEQNAIILRLYPTLTLNTVIIAEILACQDGVTECDGEKLRQRARKMGLHRPVGFAEMVAKRNAAVTNAKRRRTGFSYRPKFVREAAPVDPRKAIPLREVFRHAMELGCARSIEAVSRAYKQQVDPNHKGFRLQTSWGANG